MNLLRRHLLQAVSVLIAAPFAAKVVFAQTPTGPKLTQILRKDMEGQNQAAQETVVSIVEFGPGISAPWHAHPSAQEAGFPLDGDLVVEVEGRGVAGVRLGGAYIIPGDTPHLWRNESASAAARLLVVHTRGVKDQPFVVPIKR